MKLIVLDSYEEYKGEYIESYQFSRIKEEATKLGVDAINLSKFDIRILLENGKSTILYKDLPLEFDYLFIRGVFRKSPYIKSIIHLLKKDSNKILNYKNIERFSTFTKQEQLSILSESGLAIPKSIMSPNWLTLLDESKKGDYIIKASNSSKGKDIYLAKENEIFRIYEDFLAEDVILQEKLPGGVDYRIVVLGGKSLGIMKKTAAHGQLVSNFSAGGSISQFQDPEMEELAVKAAAALDLDYAGVDIMKDSNGNSKILEVNRSAEFKGFEQVTGVNVAKALVEFISNK